MTKSTIFLFGGQGSQYYHMGRELYDNNNIFRKWFDKGENLFQISNGISLIDTLFNKQNNKTGSFNELIFTHPSIFLFEYSLCQALMKKGVVPQAVLGSSLGEFCAATIAGVLSFKDSMNMVISQAKIIKEHCYPGVMLSILGNYSEMLKDNLLEEAELAAISGDNVFTISATQEALKAIKIKLIQNRILFQELPISYGFHSKLIDLARIPYFLDIKKTIFSLPTIPFFSCIQKEIINKVSPEHFWNITRNILDLSATINSIEKNGSYIYMDCTPSGTMATLIKYILDSSSHSIVIPVTSFFRNELEQFKSAIEKWKAHY